MPTSIRPFQKVLCANRGEIAIRVFRACAELGIRTVAVFSEEDAANQHRYKADESYLIGRGKSPVAAYLGADEILAVAKAAKVDAIHPGYGFLSENANFAAAVRAAGIAFLGPRAEVISGLGDKVLARNEAERLGIPTVPGSELPVDEAAAIAAAEAFFAQHGVTIFKAAHGGGGRGMRVVDDKKNLVQFLRQDYRKTLKAYDSPDTFFFIDPPYPGEWFDKDKVIDLEEFVDALAKVRGKFIAVLNPTPENVAAFKRVGHVFRLKVREASGRGGAKQAMRLFVANYPVRKAEDFELVAKCEHLPLDPSLDALVFDKTTQLVKGLDPNDERYVLGIVLEPEVVDAQGDIYSADEIRAAAHRFMEEFGGLGLMHRLRVNDQVKVLESYLAPTDFTVGELTVRKGTWMLAVRVLSDELWDRVKSGDLTGFSIGGSARRVPEPAPAPAPPPAEPDAQPQTEAA